MNTLRLGFVMDRSFHEGRRWTSICTPALVQGILTRFDCRVIQNQQDYETAIGEIDALLSLEPLWGAPLIEFGRTPALREKFRSMPSYLLNSDPHDKLWRQSYWFGNEFDFFLSYYFYPTLYHMRRLPPERVILFPWAVPDEYIGHEPVRHHGSDKLACFGAARHEAYNLRNWCRQFPFVLSTSNSGVENASMSNEEYMRWLGEKDAAIAAGSDDPKYRLTVPKYYEIAATGALLFAQETDDLPLLGFEHMKNCIVFNRQNFEELAREYLSHPLDFLPVREAGREFVRTRHSLSARLESLELHMRENLACKADAPEGTVTLLAPSPTEEAETPADTEEGLPDAPENFFEDYFQKICIPEILSQARRNPLTWQGRTLEWEVSHEILAYQIFSGGRYTSNQLIDLSNRRYERLAAIWPGADASRMALDEFYRRSAEILPWGHGVFMADHNTEERRANWMRRVRILEALQRLGAQSLVDYGAGGGHTSLLAKAMGFERVIHHEYAVFHPYVLWRAEQIPGGEFIVTDAAAPLALPEPADAILCVDVPEHVSDPETMLDEIHRNLRPGGLLVWVACFEPTIAGHLHGHLRGQEDELLARHGFKRVCDLSASYEGHSGIYSKSAVPAPAQRPRQKPLPPVSSGDPARDKVRTHLNESQWLPRETLEGTQLERLRRLLAHAYANCPFYRERMDAAGLKSEDIRTMDDFRRLPILTKEEIQANLEQIRAANFSDQEVMRDATGGSTGQPLSFYRDHTAHMWVDEAAFRFRRWVGYQPGDKIAFIWGADRDIPNSHPENERWLNSFNCSPEKIEAFVHELVEWKPVAIRAYASSAALVAQFIKERNLPAPRPRAIECSAEKLYPEWRALIEEVFGCPAFDSYGSREIPAMACDCEEHDGLHVFSDLRLVEVIRDGRPAESGEEGAIVVTDLVNYGMPFIRYQNGDVGRFAEGACRCGRAMPRLHEVVGRVTSTITCPDGRLVHGEFFTHLFYNRKGVKAFQVHQTSLTKVEVSILQDETFDPGIMDELILRMREHLGPEVNVRWQSVAALPPAPSGKRHFTISDVPVKFASAVKQSRKPRVLFIVDAPNWAHDIKTINLMRCLSNEFDLVKRYQSDVTERDLDSADLIVIYYWLQLGALAHLQAALDRNKSKLLIGVCSHVELEGRNRPQGLAAINRLARGVFVNSRLLQAEFAPEIRVPVFYAPNGVDTTFFTPGSERKMSGALRVGWAGSLGNMNNEVRGYHEFIVPACRNTPGVELVSAIREEKWRGPEEMREFYRSIDVYLCASRKEGTPNPCLEAAACGVPLLTTRVGNMPELVKDGVNGIFVERNVDNISSALGLLRDNPALRRHMRDAMLNSIKEWDWSKNAENFRMMFREILKPPATPQPRESASGFSFCIITGGKRPEKLAMAIRSIQEQAIPDYEIIVSGKHHEEEGIVYVPQEEAAAAGRLGEMRNRAVARARYDHIVLLDDDIILAPDWYEAVKAHAGDYDILTSRILLPDGTRYWDYASFGGKLGHRILSATEKADENVYMSGGCAWVMRSAVADAVQWESNLGFYEGEDVAFARRCIGEGFKIAHEPAAVAWHCDPIYTRVGRGIFKRAPELDHEWLLMRPELLDPQTLMAMVQKLTNANRVAELADCLRAGMQLHPHDKRFQPVWEALTSQFGGDPGGDCWTLGGDPNLRALLDRLTEREAVTI